MPFKILEKRELGKSGQVFEMVLETPLIARKAHGGNFILIRINETGERFPLTIADYDREKGTITIVVQVVGKSTKLLSHQKVGDEILDIVGPLGNQIHIEKYDSIIIVSDENGNSMEISKSKNQSIILSLYGIFTSGKKKEKTIKDNK